MVPGWEDVQTMPRPKVFTIGLSAADREFLSKLTVTGMHPARIVVRGSGTAGVG